MRQQIRPAVRNAGHKRDINRTARLSRTRERLQRFKFKVSCSPCLSSKREPGGHGGEHRRGNQGILS